MAIVAQSGQQEPVDEFAQLAIPQGWRRLFSPFTHRISGKIISPYLILVVILAIFATYVVMNLVTGSLEEKFRSQLADAGRAANETMVELERDHLQVLRQMAFTEGVAEMVEAGDADQLLEILAPIVSNGGVDYVDLLDMQGDLLLAIRPPERAAEAASLIDRNVSQWPPVRRALDKEEDELGDKFAALVQTPWGLMLYSASPVKVEENQVGVIAVGTPLDRVVARLSQGAIAGITLYGPDGAALTSTLQAATAALRVEPAEYDRLMGADADVLLRTVSLRASRYLEILGALEVRRQPVLLMGVSQSVSLIADKGAETRNQMIIMFSTVTFLVLLTGLILARRLTRPIMVLVAACKALAAGELREVPVISKDETGLLIATFNQSLHGLRERDRAKDAFGRYMSPELYEAIQRGELQLGGEKREITILMSDIRSFTSLSEAMDPHDLVALLNLYFETQVAAIQRYGGTVDKFMGDAILAKFGAPLWYPDHGLRAVLAMLDMRAALTEFNGQREAAGLETIRIGIGANTGPAVVGNIGSTARMEYTIIGDTVNATQRIEDLSKELKWDLLIGDTTYEQAKDVIEVGEPHPVTLRGRQQETLVYPLIGLKAGLQTEEALRIGAEAVAARAASGNGEHA